MGASRRAGGRLPTASGNWAGPHTVDATPLAPRASRTTLYSDGGAATGFYSRGVLSAAATVSGDGAQNVHMVAASAAAGPPWKAIARTAATISAVRAAARSAAATASAGAAPATPSAFSPASATATAAAVAPGEMPLVERITSSRGNAPRLSRITESIGGGGDNSRSHVGSGSKAWIGGGWYQQKAAGSARGSCLSCGEGGLREGVPDGTSCPP